MMNDRADNDETVDEGKGGNALSMPTSMETFKILGPADLRNQVLLPGLPNDLASQVTAPMLSGTDLNTLSLVSPSWRETIHCRWVYDARVRSHSAETFAVLRSYDGVRNLRLYPLNGNCVFDLPRSPQGISYHPCTIPLGGKMYILGRSTPCSLFDTEMFMLDLAGHKKWKQCASMQEGREYFGAGVLDGKIYVVGGSNDLEPQYKCEVYDPKVNAWSSIADLIPLRYEDRVASIGGELFAYGGCEWTESYCPQVSRYAVAYNPGKNEWRQPRTLTKMRARIHGRMPSCHKGSSIQ